MPESVDATFTTSIRSLTAEEYIEILTDHDVELRVSDGTRDGTWRFWVEDDELVYRRLSWTQNKPGDAAFLQSVLDGDDITRQLVAADN